MACKYQNQYPMVYDTGYRILLSLLAGIAISANLQSRYNESESRSALDLPLELFAEKNLAHAPSEFGYAVGGSHILASASSAKPCTLCRQSFAGRAEV